MVPEEIDEVVSAFQYLRARPFVDPERIAVIGFSVGAGVGLVAASDARIRDEVALFGSFGGYYDLYDVITAATTETITSDGRQTDWEPADKTLRVLRRSLIYYVDDADDRDLLARIFLDGDDSARQELGPLSRAIFDILDGGPARSADCSQPAARGQAARPSLTSSALGACAPSHHHARPPRQYIPHNRITAAGWGRPRDSRVHYAEMDIFSHVDKRASEPQRSWRSPELLFQVSA
jgi:acetyl esterase/lipase